jgi:hypothetical protein
MLERPTLLHYLHLHSQPLFSLQNMPFCSGMLSCLKIEMLDYLEYVGSSGVYKSETIETVLEFTPNVKNAIEVSINVS